jgi:2,3-dihydroxy-p-cumate/2,3-dihydroxybenzoate 3,4-dioxygenase
MSSTQFDPPGFRYRKPGYVALNVSDLDQSLHFYQDLVGLTLVERRADALFFRCSDDHHNLILYQAQEPGLKRIGFQLESDADLAQARQWITQLGWAIDSLSAEESRDLCQGESFRFRLPDCGIQFEFYAQMDRAPGPFVATLAKIQRLGHIVISVKEQERVIATLTQKLNFRVSDHFGTQVSFLRCFPNPYHHSLGVARGDADRFHHVNFMVSDVDDVGRAMNRMRKNGVEIVYGPGRHDISNSIFLYYLDPDKLTVEYSFGMEEFSEIDARPARVLPMLPEILDAWGGLPAPAFAKGGTIEQVKAQTLSSQGV